MIALHFILGESPQWLLAQKKYDQAIKSISKAASINGKSLHADTIQRIEQLSTLNELADEEKSIKWLLVNLLRQKTLALRLLITSLVWMFIYFAYYGIIVISTTVHSNKYLSFALIALADFPGTVINDLLLNRIGRRLTVGVSTIVYSVVLAASTQLPRDQETLQLILFVVAKAAIYAAFSGFSTHSTEFWPTSIRNTSFNICSMAGRLGSILASMAVLLGHYYVNLPVLLNAAGGIVGAVLLFAYLPETMHLEKLPDTMEEALDIGKSRKKSLDNNNEISESYNTEISEI